VSRQLTARGTITLLPAEAAGQESWLATFRTVLGRYGFVPLEPSCMQPLEVLQGEEGATSKELFEIRRVNDPEQKTDVGLRFDQTYGLAATVASNLNHLKFPLRAFQVGRVFRGERPQRGRLREFIQADADVIAPSVSLAVDAELVEAMCDVFARLNLGKVQFRLNNRKILQGYLEGLGLSLEQIAFAMRILDKLDKIGEAEVVRALASELAIDEALAKRCLALASIKSEDASFVEQVHALGVENEQLSQGLEELAAVLKLLEDLPAGSVQADLSIARGLDYYTGTVYECYLLEDEALGSICSGGRYANLVGRFTNRELEGVGLSIGITRLLLWAKERGLFDSTTATNSAVLVVSAPREEVPLTTIAQVARAFRKREIAAEVYAGAKADKGLRYANDVQIPYVAFIFSDGQVEVKDLKTGDQERIDRKTWLPKDTTSKKN